MIDLSTNIVTYTLKFCSYLDLLGVDNSDS